jgi:uncharacterized protein YgbK (DUF1537 family)
VTPIDTANMVPLHTHEAISTILIVADDLTGAADCAVQFRQAGLSAVVLTRLGRADRVMTRTQVLSLNLHTRDLPSASQVCRVWRRAAPLIVPLAREALVYQKIDSTLRGHPALEVRLLLDLLGLSAAVIAPAFPKLGRQTLDGVHRVHGVPLAETEYARQRPRAQASSSLPEVFAEANGTQPAHLSWRVLERGTAEVSGWLREHLTEAGRLITADAVHEQHLDSLTRAVLALEQSVLLVGSAGWAEQLALACAGSMAKPRPALGVLGVVGSLNATATRQVEVAARSGATVVPFTSRRCDDAAGATTGVCQGLTEALAAGRSVVIWTHPGAVESGSRRHDQRVLRALAADVREILSTTAVSGLAIVGGDTAQAVFQALRASGLRLCGEVAAGIPYGQLMGGPFTGLPVATKAGGFGTDTALWDCLDFLRGWAAQ